MIAMFDKRSFRVMTWGLAAAGALSLAGAASAKDEAEHAGDPQDKMICKRFVETGSLVKSYRSCKAKRDWDRERLNIRTSTAMSGGCNSAESGSCLGSSTVAGITTPIPN